jgi:hypothetical protein
VKFFGGPNGVLRHYDVDGLEGHDVVINHNVA